MNSAKHGWSVAEWSAATSIGRTKVFDLIGSGAVTSVTAGRRRIITTQPDQFLRRLASEHQTDAAT